MVIFGCFFFFNKVTGLIRWVIFSKDVDRSVGSFPGVAMLIVDSSEMRLIIWLISEMLLALLISYFLDEVLQVSFGFDFV